MTTKQKTVFVAYDGDEFDDAEVCLKHERIQRVKTLLGDLCVSDSWSENENARIQAAELIIARWADIEAIMNDE